MQGPVLATPDTCFWQLQAMHPLRDGTVVPSRPRGGLGLGSGLESGPGLRNSVLGIKGELGKRLLGEPMGGFLSTFYAMLNFAYVEHKCVQPMFTRMGIPSGVKRYMDDIIVALLCRIPSDVTAAESFVSEPTANSPPLSLDMEPQGNQDLELLEANVTVAIASHGR